MKKVIFLLLVLAIVMSGCTRPDTITRINRKNLMKLSIGMSKQEVLNIMGTKTMHILYGAVNNPYRSEMLRLENGKTLELLYYYTDIKRRDNCITDDELTPLVFHNGELIGWGWSFVQEHIKIMR